MTSETTARSRQRSLEQERAKAAWEAIAQVKGKGYDKEYRSLARGASADIQTSGLGQTLSFWRAKGYEGGKPKGRGQNEHAQLLSHVEAWVRRELRLREDVSVVAWIVNDATTDQYRRATAEALAYLTWLRRFAEAELREEGSTRSQAGGEG